MFLHFPFQINVNHAGNLVAVQISLVLFWSVRAAEDQLSFEDLETESE
jgi:hypothetical protein